MQEPHLTLPQAIELFSLTRAEVTQLEGMIQEHGELLRAADGRLYLGALLVALQRIAAAERQARLSLAS